MTFRSFRSCFSNSSKDFLSEIDPSIIRPKNLTGLEWMEGMKDVKSDGSLGDETEKGVVFIDLPLMITMLLELAAVKVRPAHFKAIIWWESKVFAPQIVEDIVISRPWRLSLLVVRYYLDETVEWWLPESILELYWYLLKKSIIDSVQPAEILRWCICQLLGASWEKDLLNIPE